LRIEEEEEFTYGNRRNQSLTRAFSYPSSVLFALSLILTIACYCAFLLILYFIFLSITSQGKKGDDDIDKNRWT